MALFDEHGTLRAVIESALERRLGSVELDDEKRPTVGRIDLGCYAIFSGNARHPLAYGWLRELKPPVEIVLAADSDWRELVDRLLGQRCTDRPMRTFTARELSQVHLARAADPVPEGFQVAPIDQATAGLLDDDLRPHALQVFATRQALLADGFGFVAVTRDGRVAAQASSYAVSSRRVEIALATHADYRRLGLARVLAANMILECLRRGLRPEWSASNPASKRLARSLGFRPDGLCDIVFYE